MRGIQEKHVLWVLSSVLLKSGQPVVPLRSCVMLCLVLIHFLLLFLYLKDSIVVLPKLALNILSS